MITKSHLKYKCHNCNKFRDISIDNDNIIIVDKCYSNHCISNGINQWFPLYKFDPDYNKLSKRIIRIK